jgi:hypothetical protein
MYVSRKIEADILKALHNNPVVALIGARQCGKSTLAMHLFGKGNCLYLDLERPSDLQKLEDAEWFLSSQKDKLICMDEIQRKPELFSLLRSLTDEWNKPGAFLVLGSASRDLLKQSSESLAGRIDYRELSPFLWTELKGMYSLERYFSQGGFPRSLLNDDVEASYRWRENFIVTFLERDLLQWKGFTPVTMRRLWQMLAHNNGQTIDYTHLGRSLGVSSVTVKNYVDLLESTFMVKVVLPYVSNMGKRLVKAPKVYISDSGITATLLGLKSFEMMAGHSSFGAIWEQIVLSNLKGLFPGASFYYYRTGNGAEMDFVMRKDNRVWAFECKASLSPSLSKGTYYAIEDIAPEHTFVVAPVKKGWPVKRGINVISLDELEGEMNLPGNM